MRILRKALPAKRSDTYPRITMKIHIEEAGLIEVRAWTYKLNEGPWLANKEPGTKRVGKVKGREIVNSLAKYGLEKRKQLKKEMRREYYEPEIATAVVPSPFGS